MTIGALISIFGIIGTIITSITFLPQVIKVIKTSHTNDLSIMMWIFEIIGPLIWISYALMVGYYEHFKNIEIFLPTLIVNIVILACSIIILTFCFKKNAKNKK